MKATIKLTTKTASSLNERKEERVRRETNERKEEVEKMSELGEGERSYL